MLGVAENSVHPEIRVAALEMAKVSLVNEQKQTARLSPNLVLWVLFAVFLGTVSACWYAFLRDPVVAYELSGVSIILFILIAAIILYVSESLSETGLVKVLELVVSYVKAQFSSRSKREDSPSATSSENATDPKK